MKKNKVIFHPIKKLIVTEHQPSVHYYKNYDFNKI